ncbi:antibiotic biosynthesis monooxygenase family protein [Parasphingopyxis lamellibrachiae]|uniref:Heme-degrading monooxygenase HmoA n=1 Tax=Parasphingopyxis lamellibrachiae TaxID=680125 RepID=A0A3D9FFY9_9SPHN|nr:antibiotic biosynthesis monooxygenase [Parasphingopyxis lamellibrachiae]RED16558.1 heme-degrading monooxygenase HmoA [Parasphingopyxis lamellibrachiae]
MDRKPAKTPAPPYYSVTTTASLGKKHDPHRHVSLGLALYAQAETIDGFLGWEVMMETDFSIAISYWRSLGSIETWRHHEGHCGAKQLGKKWFSHCITRIALVERDYGFEE